MIGYCSSLQNIIPLADAGFDFLEIKAAELDSVRGNEIIPVLAINYDLYCTFDAVVCRV